MSPPRRAFSLIELIIVIGIITLLLALLLPALARSREQANRTTCANNLRQWGIALHAYADANGGAFPYNGGAIPPGIPVGGKGLCENSSVVQQFFRDYLVKDWTRERRAGSNVLFCPNQTWLRRDDQDPTLQSGLCGYFYLPGRDPDDAGGMKYIISGPAWVERKKLGGPLKNAPIACDVIVYDTREGSWLYTSHLRGNGGLAGGNFLFEDGHVAWYDAGDIGRGSTDDAKLFFYVVKPWSTLLTG